MADVSTKPSQAKFLAADAAIFVLSVCFALPALAATTGQIPCSETEQANLDVAFAALVAKNVTHEVLVKPIDDDASAEQTEIASSNSLLGSRAEAAIREVFKERDNAGVELTTAVATPPMAGTDSQSDITANDEDGAEADTGMNIRLPGVSDDDLSQYKKQMFRRDI